MLFIGKPKGRSWMISNYHDSFIQDHLTQLTPLGTHFNTPPEGGFLCPCVATRFFGGSASLALLRCTYLANKCPLIDECLYHWTRKQNLLYDYLHHPALSIWWKTSPRTQILVWQFETIAHFPYCYAHARLQCVCDTSHALAPSFECRRGVAL